MVKVPVAQVRQRRDETRRSRFRRSKMSCWSLRKSTGSWLHVRHRDGASGFIRVTQVWGV